MKNHKFYLEIDGMAQLDASAEVGGFEIFDGLTRIVAGGKIPRRKAFKLMLTGLAATALAELGVRSAWAAENCLCNGQTYDPVASCCTASGVQPKHPLASVAACPNAVPHPGYVATYNGCGAEGSPINPLIPGGFGAANFTPCCNNHDICYGTCNDVKATCDSTFLSCMTAACDSAYSGSGVLNSIKKSSCHGAANTFYSAVHNFGGGPFESAQDGACDCCSTSTCPQSCAGSSCGSLPSCGSGGDCVCFSLIEGGGLCGHGDTPCAGIVTCSTSADCPSGSACSNTTCCGGFPVCVPLCDPIIGPSSITPAVKSLSVSPKKGILTVGGYI